VVIKDGNLGHVDVLCGLLSDVLHTCFCVTVGVTVGESPAAIEDVAKWLKKVRICVFLVLSQTLQ